MSTLTISPEYEALLRKVRPKVIRTEKENEAYTEILYDLDIEAKEYGRSLGVRVARTQSLNDDPEFISAIAETVKPFLSSMVAIANA